MIFKYEVCLNSDQFDKMNTVKKFVVFFLRLALYLVERFWVDEEWLPAPHLGIDLELEQYSDEAEDDLGSQPQDQPGKTCPPY